MKTITDDENVYYDTFAEELRKPSPRQIIFASKTPVVWLLDELYNEMRRRYYDTISAGIRRGLFKATYLFALDTTCEELSNYFSKGIEIRNAQAQHIDMLKEILKHETFDLRTISSGDFNSCLLGDKIGAIHFKEPGTGKTKLLKFIEGKELDIWRSYFIENVIKRSYRVKEENVKGILERARVQPLIHALGMQVQEILKEKQLGEISDQDLFYVFGEKTQFEIVVCGSSEIYSDERYRELYNSKDKFDCFFDEKKNEIWAGCKRIRLRHKSISYLLLRTIIQLPGEYICYRDLYKKLWEEYPHGSSITQLVLVEKDYLNKKTDGLINIYVHPEGDKFYIEKNFKTCLIKIKS